MSILTAGKIIDRALLLEEGGAVVIPCSSYEEMEKLRVRLYKIRKQLEGKHRELAFSLDITRRISKNKDKWTLYVTKDASLSGVFILEAGEAMPFDEDEFNEKEEEKEEPVEDFDDVALKIEEAQKLEKEKQETSKNNIS